MTKCLACVTHWWIMPPVIRGAEWMWLAFCQVYVAAAQDSQWVDREDAKLVFTHLGGGPCLQWVAGEPYRVPAFAFFSLWLVVQVVLAHSLSGWQHTWLPGDCLHVGCRLKAVLDQQRSKTHAVNFVYAGHFYQRINIQSMWLPASKWLPYLEYKFLKITCRKNFARGACRTWRAGFWHSVALMVSS